MIHEISYGGKTAKVHIEGSGGLINNCWRQGLFYEANKNGILQYSGRNHRGGVFIDVGAGVGNHSLFYAVVCEADRVLSFEPHQGAFGQLNTNCNRNGIGRITLFPCALGNKFEKRHQNTKTCQITDDPNDPEVRIEMLQDFYVKDETRPLTLIKIDCEGYEMKVLAGAMQTISTHTPDIFIETTTPEAIDTLLQPLGYTRYPKIFNATPTYLWQAK